MVSPSPKEAHHHGPDRRHHRHLPDRDRSAASTIATNGGPPDVIGFCGPTGCSRPRDRRSQAWRPRASENARIARSISIAIRSVRIASSVPAFVTPPTGMPQDRGAPAAAEGTARIDRGHTDQAEIPLMHSNDQYNGRCRLMPIVTRPRGRMPLTNGRARRYK